MVICLAIFGGFHTNRGNILCSVNLEVNLGYQNFASLTWRLRRDCFEEERLNQYRVRIAAGRAGRCQCDLLCSLLALLETHLVMREG